MDFFILQYHSISLTHITGRVCGKTHFSQYLSLLLTSYLRNNIKKIKQTKCDRIFSINEIINIFLIYKHYYDENLELLFH